MQQFAITTTEKFDLVVSNPPYFNRSLPASSPGKTLARHDDTLGASDLIMAAERLLTKNGALALVLPVSECASFSEMAREQGLHEHRSMTVFPVPGKSAHRIMSVWGLIKPENHIEEQLVIEENGRHKYAAAYI